MPSKSRSLKSTGKRSFTIHTAHHIDGCPTKFSHGDYSGIYHKHSPQRAAENALNNLCRLKQIRGRCTLYIEMRETTQGSDHKIYAYRAKRVRLAKPIELGTKGEPGYRVLYYKAFAKPIQRVPTEDCPKSHKSSGRMVGSHSKKLYYKLTHSKHSSVSRSHSKKSSKSSKKSSKSIANKLSNSVRRTMKRVSKML